MLVKYEFLKLLRRKSTFIIMAVSLSLTAFLFGLPVIQYQISSRDGMIKGAEGIRYEKEQYSDLSVTLTEEYITKAVLEVQQLFKQPDAVGYDGKERFLIGDAYWNHIAPREKLLNLIAQTWDSPGESSGYNKLPELDVTGGAGFYQAMEEKREAVLSSPSRSLSKEKKAYWSSMAGKVNIPLQYGYYGSWEIILSSFELLMFAILAVCMVIAPVFSGEYQMGTDAVILSGKYGKTKLITAKIAASFLFGFLAFTLHVAVAFGLPLVAFGVDGWNLPLQAANTAIPYPFTFLQAALVALGIVYLILSAMISLTLFLSSKMKAPYAVLAVLVPVLFFPVFLTPNGSTGAYNLTLFLLPYRAVIPETGKYISYQFGSLVLDVFSIRAALYGIFTVGLLPLAGLGFRKHQVL